MAVPRAPVVVGIVVIAGGIAWFALRDRNPGAGSGTRGDSQGSAALTTGSGKAAISAPAGPRLGSGSEAFTEGLPLPDGGTATVDALTIDAPSHRDVFVTQTRDPGWATRTESEIKKRFRALSLGVTLDALECRANQCELTISGASDDIATAFDRLESKQGLGEFADKLLLSGPEQRDGTMIVRAYAMFERSPE
ncbi:MAG: hypothetical protein JWP01_2085 [Myxococcales bacterium]|nr:hypothetical protein [Myxococcales bacterium]